MFNLITPILLTYNEAPNIERTLNKLSWALDIVVVDSFSQDETLAILQQFPQVRVFQKSFDNHANQWNFALQETGITTDWVLALDADYVLSDDLVAELGQLSPVNEIFGYEVSFVYSINGKPLRGAAYPPVTALYRRTAATYQQDGHTQRIAVSGRVEKLLAPIYHDDRKPLSHWVQSQIRYMRLEAEKLSSCNRDNLGWADRLRLLRVVAPFVMVIYCLFVKGAILDGRAGIYYAFQRMFAELLLSLFIIEKDLGLG
jgi:glycosyltransferase involved in cell wall biosynthesis